MGRQRQFFRLSAAEQQELQHYLLLPALLRRQTNRAHTLLDWHAGLSAAESAEHLAMTEGRVYALRRAYQRQGLTAYLNTQPGGGAPTKLTPAVESALLALLSRRSADAPRRWTLRQLAAYLVAQGHTKSICPVTVGKALHRLQLLLPGAATSAGMRAA
ncbi:helix-turn-helix domain-containing protein [Hymenobacter canadensis]|uniref:Helix-turn-helix domain-containing protein n=1 Tax=Hymenobacter canadensis TaxID=2999067 RepID=A0ABY7LUS3_9BACT|nr:helix-turn-helix domain-containing protein [Hymenobacter canadensis]WBA43604.1 helix-turn-helix domain-containing protein [Hymenobacter canadensis]